MAASLVDTTRPHRFISARIKGTTQSVSPDMRRHLTLLSPRTSLDLRYAPDAWRLEWSDTMIGTELSALLGALFVLLAGGNVWLMFLRMGPGRSGPSAARLAQAHR